MKLPRLCKQLQISLSSVFLVSKQKLGLTPQHKGLLAPCAIREQTGWGRELPCNHGAGEGGKTFALCTRHGRNGCRHHKLCILLSVSGELDVLLGKWMCVCLS